MINDRYLKIIPIVRSQMSDTTYGPAGMPLDEQTITRWTLAVSGCMKKYKDGHYVRYADHAVENTALRDRVAELEEALGGLVEDGRVDCEISIDGCGVCPACMAIKALKVKP